MMQDVEIEQELGNSMPLAKVVDFWNGLREAPDKQ